MRMTLTYRGPLPPRQRRVASIKTGLREEMHPQIKSQVEPRISDRNFGLFTTEIGGASFLSPAHRAARTAIELDVLMLSGGSTRAGDVDNRLKTLIDGLTRPANPQQLEGHTPRPGGGPTFCLLDDDNLVQSISLDSRRWHAANNEADTFVVVTARVVLAEDSRLDDTPFANNFLLL